MTCSPCLKTFVCVHATGRVCPATASPKSTTSEFEDVTAPVVIGPGPNGSCGVPVIVSCEAAIGSCVNVPLCLFHIFANTSNWTTPSGYSVGTFQLTVQR